MTFNWKKWLLNLLALAFICLFTSLGYWQLSRAHEKEKLLASFAQRTAQKPVTNKQLYTAKDWRFYQANVSGYFDNQHTFLLDNRTYQKKVGYEVYTPFITDSFNQILLVDRGFIPIGSRTVTPEIKPIIGHKTITGIFNLPPTYVALGEMTESKQVTWPLRVEYVQLAKMGEFINKTIFPYVLILDPKSPFAYALEWKVVIMPPERHRGYALQWFAFALTLLIISAGLNYRYK